MKNRLVLLLLIIVSVSLLFSLNADSQETQETVIRVAPHALESNTQTVDIVIENGQNVAGYQVLLQFNSASLTYIESQFQHGDYLPEDAFFGTPKIIDIDTTDSFKTIRFAAVSYTGESNGNGILATLKFNKSRSSSLTLLGGNDGTLLSNMKGEISSPRLEHSQSSPAAIRDLMVESVQVIPVATTGIPSEEARYSYNKGEKFQFRATVRNRGNVLVKAQELKISRIPIDTEKNPLTVNLEELDILISPNRAIEISVPDAIFTAPDTHGTYYYDVCVGIRNDRNEDNNCSDAIKIEVGLPDLVIESITASLTGNIEDGTTDITLNTEDEFYLHVRFRNEGAVTSDTTKILYYQSTNAFISENDTLIATGSEVLLSGNDVAGRKLKHEAPTKSGIYYYGVCAESVPNEINTVNNCSETVKVTVKDDVNEPKDDGKNPVIVNKYQPYTFGINDGVESRRCVAYSYPDGDVLAAGDNSGNIYLWNATKGSLITTLLGKNDHHGDVRSIAFSPDGNYCAAGTNGWLLIWKKQGNTWTTAAAWSNRQRIRFQGFIRGSNITVRSVAFSGDSQLLACGTDGDHLYVYEKLPGKSEWNEKEKDKINYGNNVTSVAFHPIKLRRTTDGEEVYRIYSGNDVGYVYMDYYPDSSQNVSSVMPDTYSKGYGKVHCIAISTDGEYVAAGFDKGYVLMWSTDNWQSKMKKPHTDAVLSLDFHPTYNAYKVLASCGDDGEISFWDTFLGNVNSLTVGSKISSITFSPLGHALAIGTEGKRRNLTWGKDISSSVFQFTYTYSTEGFLNQGDFDLKAPDSLISDVAFGENATYFILNVQYPELIDGNFDSVPIYKDCVITLDLDVPATPVEDANSDDDRLDDPGYFMYSLETPRQRIEAIDVDTGDNKYKVVTTLIGAGIGLGIGAYLGSVIPFAGTFLGATVGQLTGRAIGSVAGFIIGVGIRKAGVSIGVIESPQDKAEQKVLEILKETADPFFIIQPDPDATTSDHTRANHRVLFLIEKQMTEFLITIEQGYQREENGPLYMAKFTRKWNLETGIWGAPSAKPISLADYPPFRMLPPEEQQYLLHRFGKHSSANAEQSLIPEKTSLLPNYPNPFNPETWIPYQLAKPANVTLTIYDINGRVVRDLDLGHQRAGIYQSRARAAHWDGKNTHGEHVASGVYFYTLKAGGFTATHKMLIRK